MSLEFRNVNFIYDKPKKSKKKSEPTDMNMAGLRDISFTINDGEFVGIIGHTGSGKSTLVQHMNGLIKADSGDILYNGKNIYDKGFKLSELRKNVGLVFQYPEYQLFKSTVLEDVAYGPYNKHKDEEKAKEDAKMALQMVDIGEELYETSPFELSGGQKRRVAIAGILAMKPDVLVLDEPTAGLDPRGRDEILNEIKRMQENMGISVVLVSHSMEDVARYVDRIIVMNDGEILHNDTPKKVFAHYKELEKIGLSAPACTYLQEYVGWDETVTTVDEAVDAIERWLS